MLQATARITPSEAVFLLSGKRGEAPLWLQETAPKLAEAATKVNVTRQVPCATNGAKATNRSQSAMVCLLRHRIRG